MDRRRFLKYASVALLIVLGTAYALQNWWQGPPVVTTPRLTTTPSSKFNTPPQADFYYRTFGRTLKYIPATDEDTIVFINTSTDPDGDKLGFSWFVDGHLVNATQDHWTKLTAGNHTVTLHVSDGVFEASATHDIVVEQSEVYPKKPLHMQIKGMKYHIGRHFLGDYGLPPSEEEIQESLWVIRYELGCNAIDLFGDYEDVMLMAAEMAIQMGFELIILDPYYQRSAPNTPTTIDQYVQNIEAFSKAAEDFREMSESPDSVVLSVGNELTNYLAGATYDNLNTYLETIVQKVRANFHGRITYLAANQQAERFGVDWKRLNLDIIAPHMYYAKKWTSEDRLIGDIQNLKRLGQTLYSSEFGCETWLGASQFGGYETGHNDTFAFIYSQEEQATNIAETLEIYFKAKLAGATLWVLINKWPAGEDLKSMGILKYNGIGVPASRKLGFYMYRSYVLEQMGYNLLETSTGSSGNGITSPSMQSILTVPAIVSTRTFVSGFSGSRLLEGFFPECSGGENGILFWSDCYVIQLVFPVSQPTSPFGRTSPLQITR